jgi:hypothetical protein
VETLVSAKASGVVLLVRLTSTPAAPLVTIVPLVVVIVLVFSVADNPFWLLLGEMSRSPKVIVPVFVVRLTPVPLDVVTAVLPKLSVPLEVFTLMPIPVDPLIVVVPTLKLPAAVVRLIPVVVLLAEEMLANVAASVPFVSDSA